MSKSRSTLGGPYEFLVISDSEAIPSSSFFKEYYDKDKMIDGLILTSVYLSIYSGQY